MHRNKQNLRDIQELQNDYGQVIRVGDTVHYPAWRGYLQTGTVKRILEYDGLRFNYESRKYEPDAVKHELRITRPVQRWVYNPQTGKGEYHDARYTATVYYTGHVVKLEKPEVAP